MSAILSADDLNDFISPGVACIKPIETLPKTTHNDDAPGDFEVTTEDKLVAANPAPAQISLTDCLACSGCVTSAEAVLVSLQSHTEVLTTLDTFRSAPLPWAHGQDIEALSNGFLKTNGEQNAARDKIFVASVSPQVRASLAATYGVSSVEAGNMIMHLLSGKDGLACGGVQGSSFAWVLDTNVFRELALHLSVDEVSTLLADLGRATTGDGTDMDHQPKRPILTSACPGWICYVEKTHPHILPHLSRLKSPQALAGTMIKSILSRVYGVPPSRIWHLAVMPCFDKKLEASRSELTSESWLSGSSSSSPIRDVDCVITSRELISLSSARSVPFYTLPRTPLKQPEFPDSLLQTFLFPPHKSSNPSLELGISLGTSGGFLTNIIHRIQLAHPDSSLRIQPGRNADVTDYILYRHSAVGGNDEILARFARYYGFRNIQNLVRRLKPAKPSRLLASAARSATSSVRRPAGAPTVSSRTASATAGGPAGSNVTDYAYVEVMACPGGCTNGGGQVRAGEAAYLRGEAVEAGDKVGTEEQKAWLARVDEAYYSAEEAEGTSQAADVDAMDVDRHNADEVDRVDVAKVLQWWSQVTGVELKKLVYTGYRKVDSDVGKKVSDVERVAGLAGSIGGGW